VSTLLCDGFIISRSRKIFIILELTVPMEENIEKWHQKKWERYSKLVCPGWQVHLCMLEIGCRGFIPTRFFSLVRQLGFNSLETKKRRVNLQLVARKCSYIIWINRFNKDFNSTLRVSSDGVSVVANSSGVPVPLSDDVQARITRNRESAFLKLRATRNRRAAVLKLRATRNRNAALLKLRKKKFLYRAKPTQVSKAPMQVSSPTISTGAVTLQVVVPKRPIVRAPPAPPHLSTFPQSPDPLKSTSTPTQVPVPLPVPTSSVIADISVEVQSAVKEPVHSVSTYGSRWKLLHLPGLPLKNTLNKCWYHAGLHLLSTIPALRALCSSPPKGISAFALPCCCPRDSTILPP